MLWIIFLSLSIQMLTMIYMLMGMIKPKNNKLGGREGSRKKILIHGAAIIGTAFVLMIVLGIFFSEPEKAPSPQPQVHKAAIQQPQPQRIPTPEERVAAVKAKQEEEAASLLETRKFDAQVACRNYMKQAVNYPETIKTGILDTQTIVRDSGKIVIFINFTAKNAFGVTERFVADCQFMPPGMKGTMRIRKR